MSVLIVLSAAAALGSAFALLKFRGAEVSNGPALRKLFALALAVSGAALLFLLIRAGALNFWSSLTLVALAASVLGIAGCSGRPSLAAKFSATALFLLSLGFTGLFLWQSGAFGERQGRPELNLDKFECARAFILGKRLAEMHPGAKALIISGWTSEGEKLAKAQLEELKKGFGEAIEVKAEEIVPVERKKGKLPRWGLPRSFDAKAFDGLLQKHRDCSLVVSTVGLPGNVGRMAVWKLKDSERPRFGLLDADTRPLGGAIRAGYISAVAAYRPGWTYSPATPEDPQKAFDMRYFIITKDNVDAISKSFNNVIR